MCILSLEKNFLPQDLNNQEYFQLDLSSKSYPLDPCIPGTVLRKLERKYITSKLNLVNVFRGHDMFFSLTATRNATSHK